MDPKEVPGLEGDSAGSLSPDQSQDQLTQQLQDCEARLQAANEELQSLRRQQASEMEEVESYVAHIRGLLEERESLTADYERDNEQLRLELHHIQQQQEVESKELAEMLAQKDLGEIGLTSPSELVAYLLVERATLLERLEDTERRLEGQSLSEDYREKRLQEMEHLRQSVGEGLWTQKEEMQTTMENMAKGPTQSPWKKLFGLRRSGQSKYNLTPARIEEITQERLERERLERDLEEASRRLAMAHQDIRRLTNELDMAKNNNTDLSVCEGAVQEVEILKKEVDKLKSNDMVKLQKAKDQNDNLDSENRALRDRMHTLEADNRNLVEKISRINQSDVSLRQEQRDFEEIATKSALISSETDPIHKRCHAALEDGLVQLKDLQRQLQRQRKEKEEVEERNEELEALLGETQNSSREERNRHEGEVEGLHRRIKSLEVELRKHQFQERPLKNGEDVKNESYLQLHLRDGSQERLALLEARLTEEKDWRKQLEVDLSAAQTALKKDKEALQAAERELKKLKLDVNSLQTECQQGKTLIKSLTQVKGEKAILEEKMAQLERAHSRLQTELVQVKDVHRNREAQRGSDVQMEHLQQQADRLRGEVESQKSAYNKLREEMASERQQTSKLQTKLSASVQEKISAEGERERLRLEVQRLNDELHLQKEQLQSRREAVTAQRLSPVRTSREEGSNQELTQVQAKLERERDLSSQQLLALQAQLAEAQAHVKSQDSVLNQRAEEARQMKQDLQRAQSLFTSAERELRYEKEKNMDIKKHNMLLEQEKLKLCAELKQLQTKLILTEQSVQSQVSECSRQQNKIRELELELARSTSTRNATSGLQEELQAERVRLVAADKKIVELQQQLKAAQHMLRLEEARAGESSRLERDSRDLSDALSALRTQQHEEHITRKLLEQREEELQQQVKAFRLKEASLNRSNSELSLRSQQLDTRLVLLESELSKAREEEKNSQKSSFKLQEELALCHSECERLQSELQQLLLQLDSHVRKYNEKQSQHRTKLRQAKQVYLKATAQRDRIIQKLENDLLLASSLCHKEKERTDTVMVENEKLLEERRELLQRISEAEEMGSRGMRTASTIEHKVSVLEAENRQLQERTLKLSNQVCSLERALRNVHALHSLELQKKQHQEGLSDLHTSTISFSSAPREKLDILDALCRVKVDRSRLSSSFTEQSYLNLTSPSAPADAKDTEDGPPQQDAT